MLNKDVWKHVVVKKKSSWGYGETDFKKKIISINKANHKSKGNHKSDIKKNKDGTANLLDTIVHEHLHKAHPKMHEKTVRKIARKRTKKLSKKIKRKLYAKYK